MIELADVAGASAPMGWKSYTSRGVFSDAEAMRYLFRFGCESPAQHVANIKNGWDDESSGAFWVDSAEAAEAETLGCQVANEYVHFLFALAGVPETRPWREASFSYWLEEEPNEVFSEADLERLRVVARGHNPDFASWKRQSPYSHGVFLEVIT